MILEFQNRSIHYEVTFVRTKKEKGLESCYMKTHCITLKQSEVGAKTIRFDVLERNKKWR